jgi:hypothetical protein
LFRRYERCKKTSVCVAVDRRVSAIALGKIYGKGHPKSSPRIALKRDLASRKAAMPPSLSWKFTEKEFTEQVKDVKLFVKCIQAITLNLSPLLCGFVG